MEASDQRCPTCHATRIKTGQFRSFDTPDHRLISVCACESCALAWQFPLSRSEGQSVEFFADQYQAAEQDSYFDSKRRVEIALMELDVLNRLVPERGTLLDIGAGAGEFVRCAADAGWESLGLEPAHAGGFEYESSNGCRAVLSTSTLAAHPGKVFRAVTLWDVIEHLERPAEMLTTAVAALAMDGLLVVETGNYQSMDRIEGAGDWWCYQQDHRWYFSPGTLARLVRDAGLPHVYLYRKVLRPGFTRSMEVTPPGPVQLARRLLRRPWAASRTIRTYRESRHAIRTWRDWVGIPIFTLVASRAPLQGPPGLLLPIEL